jgi:hypothetical protein
MTAPFKSYAFECAPETGRAFVFDVTAQTPEQALERVRAMASAILIGQLIEEPRAPGDGVGVSTT